MGIAPPGTFTGAPPTDFTLCEQLGRFWASRSTYQPLGQPLGQPLTFCEPTASTAANIYSADLPDAPNRREVAASISVEGQQQAIGDPMVRFTVAVECHARTPRDAVALGANLVESLFDRSGAGRWWFNEPVERDGVDIRGAVGLPAMTNALHVGFWRFLTVERAGGPLWVRQPPSSGSPGRTPSGQALSVLTLIITAVPIEWIDGITP